MISFRTCFPKEYRRGQAAKKAAEATNKKSSTNADESQDDFRSKVTKTELQHAEMVQKLGLGGTEFPKAVRKERTSFTPEEDKRLLEGFHIVSFDSPYPGERDILTVHSTARYGQEFKPILL